MNRIWRFTSLTLLAAAAVTIGLNTAASAAADTTSLPTPSSAASSAVNSVDSIDSRIPTQGPPPFTDNMQHVVLQADMQNEGSRYTAVSDILKMKHDTVKNSINNIH